MAKTKEKLDPREPQDYEDFVMWAERRLHSGLLESGGKGLRSAVYAVLMYYESWMPKYKNRDEKKS